jgi:hypothetical protein
MSHDPEILGNPHLLRLSIDIRTIKNAQFKGLIYAKYPSLAALGNSYIYFIYQTDI